MHSRRMLTDNGAGSKSHVDNVAVYTQLLHSCKTLEKTDVMRSVQRELRAQIGARWAPVIRMS